MPKCRKQAKFVRMAEGEKYEILWLTNEKNTKIKYREEEKSKKSRK